MKLKEQIGKDFMTAFKSKDMDKKNFLGVIKGEIQTAEGRGTEPTDENVLGILKKIQKSLKQTNTDESKVELTYIEGYLPTLMSEEEVNSEVFHLIKSEPVNSVGDVMKAFNKEHKGKADNKMVAEAAKRIFGITTKLKK